MQSMTSQFVRGLRQVAMVYKRKEQIGVPSLTRALELTNYGEWGKLEMSYARNCPQILRPNQMLVRNLASSLNRHDYEMKEGYVQAYTDLCRKTAGELSEGYELPLVLGRDFAGVVMDMGPDVKWFTPGDEVFGCTSNLKPGCFSDFIVVEQREARHKPQSLSFVEAASLPYVAGAVLSSCCQESWKRMYYKNMAGKRVLIHGAGGGVGTMAVQKSQQTLRSSYRVPKLLKRGGAHVTTTSLSRTFKLLRSLGADDTLAFRSKDFIVDLESLDKFDLILDIPGHSDGFLVRLIQRGGCYISFKQRLYENFTEEEPDMLFGMVKDMVISKARFRMKHGCQYYFYSYTDPDEFYLDHLIEFIADGTIVPVVQDVIGLEDIPAAMKRIEKEDTQGKTVVDMLKAPPDDHRIAAGTNAHTEAIGELADG